MIDRYPEQAFRSTPTRELARWLPERPSRQETISAFNQTYAELMFESDAQRVRYQRGEFDGLRNVVLKLNSGGTLTPGENSLIRDFRILVDGELARFSRRNLITADYVREWEDQLADGQPLMPNQINVMAAYKEGHFDQIINVDQPLPNNIRVQRYTYAVGEDERRVALTAGARTEPLIRHRARQITAELATPNPSLQRLQMLRGQRDVLFTQSSPYLDSDRAIRRDQIRSDAYFNSLNPMFQDTVIRDWLNGENLGQAGLVLNIPRETRRYRGWPLVIPFLIPIPLPFFEFNNQICPNGNEPVPGVFNVERGASAPSLKGAIDQQIGSHKLGLTENIVVPDTDIDLLTTIDIYRRDEPEKYEVAQKLALEELIRAGDRIRGYHLDEPWRIKYPYENRYIAETCLTTTGLNTKADDLVQRQRATDLRTRVWNQIRTLWEYRPRIVRINIG